MPDIFMPLDTTNVTKYYVEVSGRNILYRYTIAYSDRHRAELSAARTTADLQRMFDGDKGLFDRFVAYAAEQGVRPVPRDIARSRRIIEAQLRAFIARNSELDNSAFYYFIYPIDNTLSRAVQEVQGQ